MKKKRRELTDDQWQRYEFAQSKVFAAMAVLRKAQKVYDDAKAERDAILKEPQP